MSLHRASSAAGRWQRSGTVAASPQPPGWELTARLPAQPTSSPSLSTRPLACPFFMPPLPAKAFPTASPGCLPLHSQPRAALQMPAHLLGFVSLPPNVELEPGSLDGLRGSLNYFFINVLISIPLPCIICVIIKSKKRPEFPGDAVG